MGINKDLGLPFGKGMQKVAVAFDIDGTLIDNDNVFHKVFHLLTLITSMFKNVDVIVWSGGGKDYAQTIVWRYSNLLPINKVKVYSKMQYEEVRAKYDVIVAIDDVQDTRLGDVNMIVRNK